MKYALVTGASRGIGKVELLPFDTSKGAEIEAALDQWEAAHPEDYIAVLVNNVGIRRDRATKALTQEVAALVSFLASDASAYITGEVISINGGLYT